MSAASSAHESRAMRGATTPVGRQGLLPFEAAGSAGTDHGDRHDESSRLGTSGSSDDATWRAADQETGDLLVFCPACWPEVASRVQGRSGVTVRVLGTRPAWARCAACEPEEVC